MELKSEKFFYEDYLTNFINRRGISKENIQQIIFADNAFVVFYWEPFKG